MMLSAKRQVAYPRNLEDYWQQNLDLTLSHTYTCVLQYPEISETDGGKQYTLK